MPELPEVETTRRGIAPHLNGRVVREVVLRRPDLRWPIPEAVIEGLQGSRIDAVRRRAKYLLIDVPSGSALLHLGMSGSLRVLPAATPRRLHDHFDLELDSGDSLRFNDPRRFGSLHYLGGDPALHPLLARLAPEPFDPTFDADYLWRATRGRRVAIKLLIMNSRAVVGVGNIYASEALFRAGIRPRRQARSLKRDEVARLVAAIREVLAMAIEVGGTTLRDYVGADGNPGYFRQQLFVYERPGEACRVCGTPVRHAVLGQRATYWCPQCQH